MKELEEENVAFGSWLTVWRSAVRYLHRTYSAQVRWGEIMTSPLFEAKSPCSALSTGPQPALDAVVPAAAQHDGRLFIAAQSESGEEQLETIDFHRCHR